MNTAAAAPTWKRWFLRLRLSVAVLLCALNVAMIVPNLSGGTQRLADAVSLAICIAPLLVIFWGGAFSGIVEYLGWIGLLFISIRFFL